MTKEEKRERRQLKHDLQYVVRQKHFGSFRFYATNGQLKAGAKIVADQLLAGKNPKEVEIL